MPAGSYIRVDGTEWRQPGRAEQTKAAGRSFAGRPFIEKVKALGNLFKASYAGWSEDKGARLGAALSYYAVFSLAPLLIIAIAIAGVALGEKASQGAIVRQIQGIVGQQAANAIQTMIEASRKPSAGIVASVVGAITLLTGAAGVFGEMQDALDTIWRAHAPKASGVWQFVKARFLSSVTVLGTCFLLLISMLLSAALTAVQRYVASALPVSGIVMQVLDLVVSLAVITLLFAMIFKILPQTKVAWGDVWIGAAMTALMFTVGKYVIGLYIGKSVSMSVYGAAGSLVLVIVWVYYSAQILYFGAEFTKAYANQYGSHAVPSESQMPASKVA